MRSIHSRVWPLLAIFPKDLTNYVVIFEFKKYSSDLFARFGKVNMVMNQDGYCRLATAICAKGGDPMLALPAKEVLLCFATGLTDNFPKMTYDSSIKARHTGLVAADDEIIHNSIICIKMGKLAI